MLSAGLALVAIKRVGVFDSHRSGLLQDSPNFFCRDGLWRRSVNFDAITGGQHECFMATGAGLQGLARTDGGVTLTNVDVRRVMADAYAKKFHYVGRVWET